MTNTNRKPGWDKKAINKIGTDYYGDLESMFDAHGWETNGKTFGQIAPTRVVETYGSVEVFVSAHELGKAGKLFLNPLAAIDLELPEVWLTSFYGFAPQYWGLLGFTYEKDRDNFIRDSKPGALIVCYGTKSLEKGMAGRVLGIQQVSHKVGDAKEFIAPAQWLEKVEEFPDKWNFGVECTRAWEIPEEWRPSIEEFANVTYSHDNAQTIARRCKRLTRAEAAKILDLTLREVPVYGGNPVEILPPTIGPVALKTSKAGPVSQQPFMVREAEGPKHLYVLSLNGDISPFFDGKIKCRKIVKVGFSVSPETRKMAFNAALPGDRIKWEVCRTTYEEDYAPLESSKPALAGEKAMKDFLEKNTKSLGGEFFLANDEDIDKAWKKAVSAARNWKP